MSQTLKTEYNLHLSNARAALSAALASREALIELMPELAGPSTGFLESAILSAYEARTFSGVAGDLPSAQNDYRTNSKVGGRKTRRRIAEANS